MKQIVSIRRFGTVYETGWIVEHFNNQTKQLCASPSGLPIDELRKRMDAIVNMPKPQLPGALRNDTDVIGQTVTGKRVTKKHVEAMLTDYMLMDLIHGPGAYEGVLNVEETAALKVAREAAGR